MSLIDATRLRDIGDDEALVSRSASLVFVLSSLLETAVEFSLSWSTLSRFITFPSFPFNPYSHVFLFSFIVALRLILHHLFLFSFLDAAMMNCEYGFPCILSQNECLRDMDDLQKKTSIKMNIYRWLEHVQTEY